MFKQTLSKTVLALAITTATLGSFTQVMVGGTLVTKSAGGKVTVTIADVVQSNGVIHVIDKVQLPR